MSSLKEMVVPKRLVDGSTKEDIFHNITGSLELQKYLGFCRREEQNNRSVGDSVRKEKPFFISWSCDLLGAKEQISAAACKICRGIAKFQLRQNLVQLKKENIGGIWVQTGSSRVEECRRDGELGNTEGNTQQCRMRVLRSKGCLCEV